MGNVYTVNEILVGALSDRPSPDRNIILYVDSATGKASLADGTTWNDFGGASYPGVTSDGSSGLELVGRLAINGAHIDATDLFAVNLTGEQNGLTYGEDGDLALSHRSGANSRRSLLITRYRDPINGYGGPLHAGADFSAEGSDLLSYFGYDTDGSTVLGSMRVTSVGNVLASGGLGSHGHAAQTAPRTLAQATITAITDANAKTAVQAVANALADIGALTLT